MMEVPAMEEIVNHAMGQGGDSKTKAQATLIIDQLRAAPDRWSVGLKLFFEGRSELSRFFGLSLIRDFLASAFNPSSTTYAVHQQNPSLVYKSIRDAIWSWTTCNIVQHIPIPVFILNNLVTVLALLIKLLFPENWPLAFSDLLAVGRESTAGLDLVVRVICDLEVEVVMFSEGRGKQEVIHNVLIKDAMRANENSIVKQLVEFLCQSAASARSSNVELSERCLRCLAELIGWIDISLVACESTLSCLYLALRDPELCGAVLACLLELVKKGMEPVQKIKMLHAIGLAQVLTSVPIRAGSDEADDSDDAEDELGLVVDVYLVELIGCWSKYEDTLFGVSSVSDGSTRPLEPDNSGIGASELQQLKDLAPSITSLLHSLLPISLALLNHRDAECEVATTVVPCLGRLIVLMKQQLTHKPQIDAMIARDGGKSNFFLAYDYLPPLLLGIYQQMQFEEEFSYDPSDDTDAAIIEAKKEVRKLFVNCCRVHPEPCLQLISMALSALNQPLSTAPFAPLEAAMRLVYSFSECGPQFNTLVNEGTFPALITAIHQTDIAAHPHAQVVLAYFEICVRYIRHADAQSIKRFVEAMVDRRGLRNNNKQVRCRTAYFLFKTAEALEGKASTLLSVVGSFADVILPTPGLLTDQESLSSNAMLSDSSELHLLEAIGLITSSTYCSWDGESPSSSQDSEDVIKSKIQLKEVEVQLQRRRRQQTLEEVIHLISGHIQSLLTHPQLQRYTDELASLVAHKVSCLSSLAKGHSYKSRLKHPESSFDAALAFDVAAAAVVAAAHSLGHISAVRGKCVIFHHRMVLCMGLRSLEALGHSMPLLLSHCDSKQLDSFKEISTVVISEGSSEEVLQLLNQAMLEFQNGALNLIDACLNPSLKKCWLLSAELESNSYVPASQQPGGVNSNNSDGGAKVNIEAPHFQAERISLQKQSLVFLQHVATQQCDQALYSDRNSQLLPTIFDNEILVGLQGGRGRISKQGGIALRKAATCTLTGLVKAWLSDSSTSTHPIPSSLSSALWSFLKEKALPTILNSCTDGTSLDLRDATAQAYLVDVGTFLWTLSSPTCQQDQLRVYLSEALPALGWSINAVTVLLSMLATTTPLGTFKENFKKFIRSSVIV